jgi:response regulator RpfG family c-di-GMP phosphodiesterase
MIPMPASTPDDEENWVVDDAASGAATAQAPGAGQDPWRVLIVDDDVDVHAVTRLGLRELLYKGRRIELLSAHNAEDGFRILSRTSDIALVLLDVVMESQDAGLVLARRIREELNNQLVRVVLRTGQAGQMPEQSIIVDYDINDFKTKTELTTTKLTTTVVAALRAYESLVTLEHSRAGLAKILVASADLYQIHSLREFASGVLEQVGAILGVGANGILCVMHEASAEPAILAATGSYAALADAERLPHQHPLAATLGKAFRQQRSQFEHPNNILFVRSAGGRELALSVTPPWPIEKMQQDLLEVFGQRLAAAYDHLYLFGQLRNAQEATVMALADLAEYRDSDTGDHLHRVEYLSTRIACIMRERGADDPELTGELIAMIGSASILHDVGKVSTPDHILLKPGKHTDDERAIMQTHAQIGHDILIRAAQMVDGVSYLSYAAQIAGGHHEHFDGKGYPHARAGRAIPLAARIVAIVDVFDALLHRRPYKEPWPLDDVLAYIRERRGTQFDPDVADALLQFVAQEYRPEQV